MSSVVKNVNTSHPQLTGFEELLRPTDGGTADVSTGAAVHELSNLLTIILGYSTILLETPGDENTTRERLEVIHNAAKQASSLGWQLVASNVDAGNGPPRRTD